MNLLQWANMMEKRAYAPAPDGRKAFGQSSAGNTSNPWGYYNVAEEDAQRAYGTRHPTDYDVWSMLKQEGFPGAAARARDTNPIRSEQLGIVPPTPIDTSPKWYDNGRRRIDPMAGQLGDEYVSEDLRRRFGLPMNAKNLRMRYRHDPNNPGKGWWIPDSYTIGDPQADWEKKTYTVRDTNKWGDTYFETKDGGKGWNFGPNANSPARRAFTRENLLTAEGFIQSLSPKEFDKRVTIGPNGSAIIDGEGVYGEDTPAGQLLLKKKQELLNARLKEQGLPQTDGTMEDFLSHYQKGFDDKNPYVQAALKARAATAAKARNIGVNYTAPGYGEPVSMGLDKQKLAPADLGDAKMQRAAAEAVRRARTPLSTQANAAYQAQMQADAQAAQNQNKGRRRGRRVQEKSPIKQEVVVQPSHGAPPPKSSVAQEAVNEKNLTPGGQDLNAVQVPTRLGR